MLARVTTKYPVIRGSSEHGLQHAVLHYPTGRWSLAGLDYRDQPLDVRPHTIYPFFQALRVSYGRTWDPACCSLLCPIATHSFHIYMKVFGFRPVRRTISSNDNPQCPAV
ncbi:hypothetical protein TNCV_1688271 [Trichonephila clavipes]|nr:hypothetical protein TNCV_1688271 [Trichonephila clavipes]